MRRALTVLALATAFAIPAAPANAANCGQAAAVCELLCSLDRHFCIK